jgi:nicotinate-nucleotide--dimethylbenzimidazole phosphoribosyltransferase
MSRLVEHQLAMAPTSFAAIRGLIARMPAADEAARAAARTREDQLTKPQGALGRLEELTAWLAAWQGRHPPVLDSVRALVFAGNHGVAAQGVSAYPAEVTVQMVANFEAGGAAINQLSAFAGAELQVHALALERPTGAFTETAAMSEAECLEAFGLGFEAVPEACDLLALGEMGIANTTAAAALATALFGGPARDWAGPGTGLDAGGVAKKAAVIEAGIAYHGASLDDPLEALRRLGGREIAALAGALLAARMRRVAVLLDGFVVGAAAAVLHALHPEALSHAQAAHRSAEPAHGAMLARLGLVPLLDLGLRLGEASGAALAIPILRAALATHLGMATFAEAGVATAEDGEAT